MSFEPPYLEDAPDFPSWSGVDADLQASHCACAVFAIRAYHSTEKRINASRGH